MEITKELGIKIREERIKIGISQEELAYRSGLHRTYIGAVERGERNITLQSLKKIAIGLELSITELTENL